MTIIKIYRTIKNTSSNDLNNLKYLVVFNDVANVLTAKWNPLVSNNKNA